VIALGLIYRQITGTTLRQQRQEKEKEQAAQELASKAPANSDGFSAKLLEQYKRGQTEIDQPGDSPRPLPPASPSKEEMPKPTEPGSSGSRNQRPGANSGSQSTPSAESTDAENAEYEERRARLQLDQSRRMGVWEAASGAPGTGTASAGSPLDSLIAAAKQQTTAPATNDTSNSQNGATGLEELARRLTSGGAPSASGVQGSKDDQFMAQVSQRQQIKSQAEPLRARKGHGRYSLLQGAAMKAVMRTEVSSDLSGECKAQVDRPVYDSVLQQDLLIPPGSTLICTYSTEVTPGQEVMLLAFTRLIFPNGAWVDLGGMTGANPLGGSGVPAQVNSRFWRVFGSSFLIAAVAKVAENKNAASNVTINLPGAQAGGVAASVLADVARKSLERNTTLRDELRIKPGDLITVIVSQDMVLDPAITRAPSY
jgi:type IV secretion system protein TrbI